MFFPLAPFKVLWDYAIILLVAYNAVELPFAIAFDYEPCDVRFYYIARTQMFLLFMSEIDRSLLHAVQTLVFTGVHATKRAAHSSAHATHNPPRTQLALHVFLSDRMMVGYMLHAFEA